MLLLQDYVIHHQHTPATHILVFMISNEERSKKPYALPVQCIPYKGLSDAKVRELANKIIREMVKRKMNVAGKKVYKNMLLWINSIKGFTTDGEWNSLRVKGNTRPLSVFQVRSDARAKYAQMKLQKLIGMISPFSKYWYLCYATYVYTR